HKDPIITEVETDPSTYINRTENFISEQLINFYDYSEFSNFEKLSDNEFSTVVKAEWKSCGLIVVLRV
ncbi:32988_t:CDS:1, partial [Gigaspora margarita]